MGTREWNIDDYIERLKPAQMCALSSDFSRIMRRRKSLARSDITDEVLHESYILMANIVNLYGDIYLPIFERLHREIENSRRKRVLVKAARNISEKNPKL